jgi:hypothetical protein
MVLLFHDRMVVIHQSYGTPRVIYSLRGRLDRNQIYNQLRVNRKKNMTTYQLLVPRKDAQRALDVLHSYKQELKQV